MPNHVTTRCIVTGPDSEIVRFHDLMFQKTKDPYDPNSKEILFFDFNQIIPMPPQLRIEADAWISPLENQHTFSTPMKAHLDKMREKSEDFTPEFRKKIFENFIQGIRNYLEFGYACWYDWSIHNWGTKWNSYDLVIDENLSFPLEFEFQTAWSFPAPVFEKLSAEFPMLEFDCCCFDEGWGFAGNGCFNSQNGKLKFKIGEATKELYEQVYGEEYIEEVDE